MLLLGRKMPAEKIAWFLLGLSRRAERWEMPADAVLLPMGRGDLADYLGLTEAHRVVFSERERLEALAEGR